MTDRPARLHDLDALRAFAMLLGVVLHTLLSFTGEWWIIRDESTSPVFQRAVEVIHGFRMPLFFLLSGFFTMMLWKRMGTGALLWHRTKRIVFPLALAMVTIIPCLYLSIAFALSTTPEGGEMGELWIVASRGDTQKVVGLLATGQDINEPDPLYGVAPLAHASLYQHTDTMTALLARGADVNVRTSTGDTPLHTAAFFGLDRSASVLIDAGADTTLLDVGGRTPELLTYMPERVTVPAAEMLGLGDRETISAGRARIREMIARAGGSSSTAASTASSSWRSTLHRLMTRDAFAHLWFLWFLCWLLLGFVAIAPIASRLPARSRIPRALVASPLMLLWALPITLFFQSMMHSGLFGPDTSTGLVPMPHVLGYYAVFFGAGAILFAQDGAVRALTTRWYAFGVLAVGAYLLSDDLRQDGALARAFGSDRTVALVEDAPRQSSRGPLASASSASSACSSHASVGGSGSSPIRRTGSTSRTCRS
ncbi:MAG: acyltransferase family protein [Planctomycetota bacterium]